MKGFFYFNTCESRIRTSFSRVFLQIGLRFTPSHYFHLHPLMHGFTPFPQSVVKEDFPSLESINTIVAKKTSTARYSV